jgi:hypothetical protein
MAAKKRNVVKERLAWWKGVVEDRGEVECVGTVLEKVRAGSPVEAAAKFFNLDPIEDRDLLLLALSDILFRPVKDGRKKHTHKWDLPSLAGLGGIYLRMRHENPALSDVQIAKKIQQDFPQYHSAEAIRQRLPEAKKAFILVYTNAKRTSDGSLIFEYEVEDELP